MTLLPSTAAIVMVGPLSATVTAWIAVAWLPLASVTVAATVTVPVRATPAAASESLMTLLPSTAAIVMVGPLSATVTAWVAVAWLPLASVTVAATVAVPLASAVASAEGIVALQVVPAPLTVAT